MRNHRMPCFLRHSFAVQPLTLATTRSFSTYNNLQRPARLLLIDATALMYRCHFGSRKSPTLRAHDNLDVSALFGYVQFLQSLLRTYSPSHVISCIDSAGKNSFRKLLSPAYKQHRLGTPVELLYQLPMLQHVSAAYGIAGIHCERYEGDDIIGTLCSQVKQRTDISETIVYSPDKDMLQLVDSQHNIQLHRLGHRGTLQIYDSEQSVVDYIGVQPSQVVAWLALAGDVADGIAGVNHVGPVIAARLLTQYGTIDQIIEAAKRGEIGNKKICTSLLDAQHQLPLYYELATIKPDIDELIGVDFDQFTCEHIDPTPAYSDAADAINLLDFDAKQADTIAVPDTLLHQLNVTG